MHEIEMPNYLTAQNLLYNLYYCYSYERNCWRNGISVLGMHQKLDPTLVSQWWANFLPRLEPWMWSHSNKTGTGTLTIRKKGKDIDKKEFPDLFCRRHLSTWNPISCNWKTPSFFPPCWFDSFSSLQSNWFAEYLLVMMKTLELSKYLICLLRSQVKIQILLSKPEKNWPKLNFTPLLTIFKSSLC